jgi:type II secretory pathway pseudopilin PulG
MVKKIIKYISGFTIIELAVTSAVIIILAGVLILVVNPVELVKQSRDNQRLTSLSNLSLYMAGLQGGLGSASTTYVSIPDPAANSSAGNQCQSLGLPALPSGWAYHCAGPSYYENTDGTGWIPANLTGSSFGTLPADPSNSGASGLYYTYTTDGATNFEFTAGVESKKYSEGGSDDKVASDAGKYADLYEIGPSLALTPIDYAGGAGYTGIPTPPSYNFSGFEPPIQNDGSGVYHLGRTLPVKFSLTDTNGNPVTSAVTQLVVTKIQDGIVGTTPVTLATSTNDTGNLFRVSGTKYIYNLDTGQFTAGTWQIKAAIDNGSNHTVQVSFNSHD